MSLTLKPVITLLARLERAAHLVAHELRAADADPRHNIPLLARLTAHLGIIALVIVGLLLSGMDLGLAGTALEVEAETSELPPIQMGEESNSGDLRVAVIPFTTVFRRVEVPPKARTELVKYVVQPNDTVTRIAAKYHLAPDSIMWANEKLENDPDMLSVGQELNIPPADGVLYAVQKGDTLQAVALRFKADANAIANEPFNQATHELKANPPLLVAGAFLMVPGGSKPYVARSPGVVPSSGSGSVKGTNSFIWPARACVTQSFYSWHSGVDLAAALGTPVYAADSGVVISAATGWNYGYGNMILIDHGNGFVTRYGHLSAFAVVRGQAVKKGALIGRMGSTGHSTGPHVHFEVIYKGSYRNPSYFVGKLPGRCPGY